MDVIYLSTQQVDMLQLNPPIPLDTPKGAGYAHMVIDYGQEHYLLFVCFINDTGECWLFPNRDIKMQKNFTMGIRAPIKSADPACMCHVESVSGLTRS